MYESTTIQMVLKKKKLIKAECWEGRVKLPALPHTTVPTQEIYDVNMNMYLTAQGIGRWWYILYTVSKWVVFSKTLSIRCLLARREMHSQEQGQEQEPLHSVFATANSKELI